MTAMSMRQADQALAALALVAAKEAVDVDTVAAVTSVFEPADLIHGLLLLCGAARAGYAAAGALTVAEVDDLLRSHYLQAGATP